jgi:hypothetical protein
MMYDILHHITEQYDKAMDSNSISHMLHRDPPVKPCKALPMMEKGL